jgi:hypothetical protein
MRNRYGLRAVMTVLLLALVCKVGLAQIGPRYVVELTAKSADTGAAAGPQGRVQLAGKGLAMIRFQGLNILAVGADSGAFSSEVVPDWPAADLLLVTPAGAGRYAGLAPLAPLRKLPVIVVEQASEVIPDAAVADRPQFYPLHTWDALHLRKGGTRLRVTALPGASGTTEVAGFMLEVGNNRVSYRLYVSCGSWSGDGPTMLSQRLPGADLALLPAGDAPQLMVLRPAAHGAAESGKPAALTAAGYVFTALRR